MHTAAEDGGAVWGLEDGRSASSQWSTPLHSGPPCRLRSAAGWLLLSLAASTPLFVPMTMSMGSASSVRVRGDIEWVRSAPLRPSV